MPSTTVSISDRIGQPTEASVTPSSASKLALALGGAAAVAPHRGDDERIEAQRADGLDGRPRDPRDAGDSAAADRDGDAAAGWRTPRPSRLPADGRDDGGRDVGRPRADGSIGARGRYRGELIGLSPEKPILVRPAIRPAARRALSGWTVSLADRSARGGRFARAAAAIW